MLSKGSTEHILEARVHRLGDSCEGVVEALEHGRRAASRKKSAMTSRLATVGKNRGLVVAVRLIPTKSRSFETTMSNCSY